jgi:hypothetical protein
MRAVLALLGATVLLLVCAVAGTAATPPAATSLAALGDSITRAFDTCPTAYTDCPANSWSTGTNTTVNSWLLRLRAANPTLTVVGNNDARTGAKMTDANGQAQTAVAQRADTVTILMGSNDVCTSTVAAMTPAATVGAQLTAALQTLISGSLTRRVYVGSIPNVNRLWRIFHLNYAADLVWSVAHICQSLLANPRSSAAADVSRRAQVAAQVNADNDAIQQACGAFPQCFYDNGAAYRVAFSTSDVTTRDYFHPSVSGQAKAAAAEWNAFFGP